MLCGVLLALALGLAAQEKAPAPPPSARYEISAATGKIKVDGVLDEEAWKNCQAIKLPYRMDPGRQHPGPGRHRLPGHL